MLNKAEIYSKFVQYELMDVLLEQCKTTYSNLKSGVPVDIYIDITTVFKHVLAYQIESKTDINNLSISVLNMAGHYRHYFAKKGIPSRVYLISSTMELSTVYNSNGLDIFGLINTVCKYFPLTYYISKSSNASAVILSMLQTETVPNNHKALVISNDIYAYQIPAFIPQVTLLRTTSKNPKFISYPFVMDSMFPKKGNVSSVLQPQIIPVIMAYNKCPELGLTLLNDFKKTIKIVTDLINKSKIINGYNSPSVFSTISPDIMERVSICDLYTKMLVYNNSYEALLSTWRTKKFVDPITLASILDTKINIDPDNLLNYVYIGEVDTNFVSRIEYK